MRREVKARTIVALPLFGCSFTRPIAIIHRRDQRLSVAAKRFMEMLLEPDVQRNGTPGSAHVNPTPKSHGKNGRPTKG